jgi:hypothetical protein
MKRIILAAVLSGYTATAFAGGPSCKEQAQEQTLTDSMLTSFMAQCEHDAVVACDASAGDRAGTAKAGFTRKCVYHTVGMKSCTKLLRDSFRRSLVVRSIEADEETAMLWCPAVCSSALPLAAACDDDATIGSGGTQRRADRE